MKVLYKAVLLVTAFFLLPLDGFAASPSNQAGQVYQNAVVAADHPLASKAGLEMFSHGGNVVDAAVATSFALSVVRPASCGIGGGGFMVIWNAGTREAVAIDYRERAPKKATRDMYLDPDDPKKSRGELSRKGHLAVAVPGTVAGLCYVQEHYGLLDLKIVLQPAIRLAREGFVLDDHGRGIQKSALRAFQSNTQYGKRYSVLYQKYLNRGKLWKANERFHSPQLTVLEKIAVEGAAGFYRGPVAQALVDEMRRGGGLITREDLAATKPVVRNPLQGRFDGFDIVTMPPASSGGVALLETLNILVAYEKTYPNRRLEQLGHNSAKYLHLLTEAMKHAFADRAEFLGDTDFATVPVTRLIHPDYARTLAERIDATRTKPLKSYGRYLPVEDSGTSHFSVIDHHGNAVACTETINTGFGSYVVEPKFGIVLNNEMDDFAAVPGVPNLFGLLQSEANSVQPGKKPLSSMSPTIVIKNGKAVYALGASGGPKIISSTLQVLLNMARFGMTPVEALNQPRIHHQWLPNTLSLEDPLFGKHEEELKQRQHELQRRNNLAATQAVSRQADGLRGASDPRKHGKPAGY